MKAGDTEGISDALQSRKTSQPERFKLGAALCKWEWSKMETKKPNSSCSMQDHENLIVERRMIRITESTPKTHGDHIEDGGHGSMSRYNVLHEPISQPRAAKIAMDKDGDEWRKNHLLS